MKKGKRGKEVQEAAGEAAAAQGTQEAKDEATPGQEAQGDKEAGDGAAKTTPEAGAAPERTAKQGTAPKKMVPIVETFTSEQFLISVPVPRQEQLDAGRELLISELLQNAPFSLPDMPIHATSFGNLWKDLARLSMEALMVKILAEGKIYSLNV